MHVPPSFLGQGLVFTEPKQMYLCICVLNKIGERWPTIQAHYTHRRRSLARVVEAALYFFGVANEEQFEGLLDDAEQRTMLRDWLRSTHCPRDAAASVADHDTQTTAVSNMVTAAPTTREVGSMATYSSSRVRLLNAQSQTPVVRVAQRASQANVAVPVADAAVGAAASMADAQTQSVVETARCEHEPLPGSWSWLDSSCNSDGTCCGCA